METSGIKIALVCSHGGHLREMRALEKAFGGHETFYFTYDAPTTRRLENACLVPNTHGSLWRLLGTAWRAWKVFRRERPQLMVSTGAEIALAALPAAKWVGAKIVHIECSAQVEKPSATGRVLYHFADRFQVQWPELLAAYGPRAALRGSLFHSDGAGGESGGSGAKRLRIALVQPAQRYGFSSEQPPMGLAYIAGALEWAGHDVSLLDANVCGIEAHDAARLLARQAPDIVAVSVVTPLTPGALELVRLLRKQWAKTPVLVAGGPHATVLPEELLGPEAFDYAVRGEGEAAMTALAACIAGGTGPEGLPGLSFVREGRAIHNPAAANCADIESYARPAWHLLPLWRYGSLVRRNDFGLPILTSRGCPHHCAFCYKGVFGDSLRMREPEAVVDEWQWLAERFGAREIAVVDDVFTERASRAMAICRLLRERGLDRVPWTTANGIRVTNVTRELLEALKSAGCYRVYFGAESGVQRVVDALGKNIRVEQVREAVRLAKEAGLEVGVYFMLGNLDETPEDMDRTIEFALELDPTLVQFTIATPYPGTAMFERVRKEGELLAESWEDLASYGSLIFRHGELDPDTVGAKYREALRRFYFRPRFILRRLRSLATWTGIKHHCVGVWTLLRMTWTPSK